MRHRLLLLTFVALGCGPGDDSTATMGSTAVTGSTADVTTTTTATDGSTTGSTGSTGAPTTSTGTTGVPDGNCRTQADCMDIEQCERPGSVQCGGATGCTLDGQECTDDPSCSGTPGSPQICVPDPCCGLTLCQPGCLADSDCGLAQACGADARCTAASCGPQTACPADFSCMANTCAPTPCSGDGECDGHCVDGLCSAQFGTCVSPAP